MYKAISGDSILEAVLINCVEIKLGANYAECFGAAQY